MFDAGCTEAAVRDLLGEFKSCVLGVGPQIGLISGRRHAGISEPEGYKEFAAENRSEGRMEWHCVLAPAGRGSATSTIDASELEIEPDRAADQKAERSRL